MLISVSYVLLAVVAALQGREDMAREEVMKEVMNQLPSLEGFVQEKRTQLYEEREGMLQASFGLRFC